MDSKALLNCENFEVIEISNMGGGNYKIKFSADSITGVSTLHFPVDEQPLFISNLFALNQLLLPLVFPGVLTLEFSKLKQTITGGGGHYVTLFADSTDGYGFELKAMPIPVDDGGELAELMHDLTMAAKVEVSAYRNITQLSVFEEEQAE